METSDPSGTSFGVRPGAWLAGLARRPKVVLAFVVVGLALGAYGALVSPRVLLLRDGSAGRWIVADEPFELKAQPAGPVLREFRANLGTDGEVPGELRLRAFRHAEVFVDGTRVPLATATGWPEDIVVPLVGTSREIVAVVRNESSTPALWVPSGFPSRWEVRVAADQAWIPVRAASRSRRAAVSEAFPRSDVALRRQLSWLGPLFVVITALAYSASRGLLGVARLVPSPSMVRWLLIGAWLLLAVHNVGRLPRGLGMDLMGHLEYIMTVAKEGRLPLAGEGWQTFQAPLFYLLAAALYSVLEPLVGALGALDSLRWLTLGCGLAQVQITYAAVRAVFPSDAGAQRTALLLGGLLPTNVYLAQFVGNEPLAGVTSAAVVAAVCVLLSEPARRPWWWWPAVIGTLLGLALLSKVTALVLVPITAVALWTGARQRGTEPIGRQLAAPVLALGLATLVSGWYFWRNAVLLGRPVLSGWEATPEPWWQQPGYRTVGQLTNFGESLWYPVFAATSGFWDAVYSTLWLDGWLSAETSYERRPPWHDELLVAAPWIALLPSLALVVGTVWAAWRSTWKEDPAVTFCAACVLVYLAAMFHLYLVLPIYSTAKASYALGALPAMAVLGARGLRLLSRGPLLAACLRGWWVTWAVATYLTYWS